MPNAPFPVDPALTGITIAYRNPALIADQVLPRMPVAGMEYKYWEYPIGEGFTVPDTQVGRKGRPNEIEFTAIEKAGLTKDYGLEDPIPQRDVQLAPPGYSPVDRAVEGITDLIMLDREIRTAGLVFDEATYPAGNKETLSGTSQFSDYSASTPIDVIADGLDSTLVYRPNVMVIGQAAWSVLRRHPHLIKAMHGTAGDKGMVTREFVRDLFELDDVIVGQAYLNTAKKGQTPTLSRVWGKHIALIYRNRLAGPQQGVTFGWTAQWGGRIAGQWEDRDIGLRGGTRVRVGESVEEKVVAAATGYLIKDAVA